MSAIDPAIVEAAAAMRRSLWCSQCGHALAHRACGPTHALLSAEPERHRHLAPLLDAARAESAAAVLRKVEGVVIDVLNMHREQFDFRGDFLGCSCEQGARVRHGHRLHLADRVRVALTEAVSDAS